MENGKWFIKGGSCKIKNVVSFIMNYFPKRLSKCCFVHYERFHETVKQLGFGNSLHNEQNNFLFRHYLLIYLFSVLFFARKKFVFNPIPIFQLAILYTVIICAFVISNVARNLSANEKISPYVEMTKKPKSK